MATAEGPPSINGDPELQEAVDRVMKRARDPGAMRAASDRMDLMREKMRQRVGEVDVAVDLIRECRDQELDTFSIPTCH